MMRLTPAAIHLAGCWAASNMLSPDRMLVADHSQPASMFHHGKHDVKWDLHGNTDIEVLGAEPKLRTDAHQQMLSRPS